jgi:hypothetical protein
MAISLSDLEMLVQKTVNLYNRLKSPEALTKMVKISLETVTIEFTGSFCYDCGGILTYVEDFARDFKVFVDYVELRVGQTRQITPRSFQVDYSVKAR